MKHVYRNCFFIIAQMSLKQSSQIVGTSSCHNDCASPGLMWNVFKGSIDNPVLAYTMYKCTRCKKILGWKSPYQDCRGIQWCCLREREAPYVDYMYKDECIRALRKCLCCGREVWMYKEQLGEHGRHEVPAHGTLLGAL